MKKLPIGIQTIRDIIEDGYVYVDKTPFAHRLITTGKHYFLSRPRRFGKSLFLDTLAEILKGNKELFKECAIYQTDYDWQPYPVIALDFSETNSQSVSDFEASIIRLLQELADVHEVSIDTFTAAEGFKSLIMQLHKKHQQPVVVLVDEYDSPIVDTLQDPSAVKYIRSILQTFFGTLKSRDSYLKFAFVTGISRFSKVSLFSKANNLTDLTMNAQYAAIAGYTEAELQSAFAEHMQAIAQEQGTTPAEVLATIKHWYNGYRFTEEESYVYNPFSTLNYMSERKPKSYWYDTATPSFLIDELKKHPEESVSLEEVTASHSELSDKSLIDQLDIKTLMFQTGYLTIKDYNADSRRYTLSFPNEEVREAFSESLLRHLTPNIATQGHVCSRALKDIDLIPFFDQIKTFFAELHYRFFSDARERTYHLMLQCMLRGMGLDVVSESALNLGIIDILIRLPNTYYLLELKLDKTPEEALAQIHKQQYFAPHLHKGKQLALVGVNFSSDTRSIDDWTGELLDENGQRLRVLTPDKKKA